VPPTLFAQNAEEVIDQAMRDVVIAVPSLDDVSKVHEVGIPAPAARLLVDVSRIASRNQATVHLYHRLVKSEPTHVVMPGVPRKPRTPRPRKVIEVRGTMRECDLDLGRFIVREGDKDLLTVRFDQREYEELVSKAFDCDVRVEGEVQTDSNGAPIGEAQLVDFEQLSTIPVDEV
jgi:hypothetical protein